MLKESYTSLGHLWGMETVPFCMSSSFPASSGPLYCVSLHKFIRGPICAKTPPSPPHRVSLV